MKPVSKIAASVLLFLGLMSLVVVFTRGNNALAFDTVAEQLHKAGTMTADMTVAAAGQTMTGKMMFKAPSSFRSEMAGTAVSIIDAASDRMLVLDTVHKTAFVFNMEGKPASGQNPVDFIERLRNVSRDSGKPLGEAQIDGVLAKQFNVTIKGETFIIWADAKTGAPLRVDYSQNVGNTHTTMTLDHIKLDVALDDSLFRVDPPQGYTVTQMPVSMSEPSEADVTNFLKSFVEQSGGEFPPTLRDLKTMFQPVFAKAPANKAATMKGGKPDQKMLGLVIQGGRAVAFITKLPKSADWHYAGKGKKFGDAAEPIFWCLRQGASQYHVIYGDLHESDVPAGRLPQDPASESQSNP